jgi:hypothetical protein
MREGFRIAFGSLLPIVKIIESGGCDRVNFLIENRAVGFLNGLLTFNRMFEITRASKYRLFSD